jgi:hypothetical protein
MVRIIPSGKNSTTEITAGVDASENVKNLSDNDIAAYGFGVATGIGVASAAANGTYGAYVEMVASTASAIELLGLVVGGAGNFNGQVEMKLALGAAASEVDKMEIPFIWSYDGANQHATNYIPLHNYQVAASQRITLAATDWSGGAVTYQCKLIYRALPR